MAQAIATATKSLKFWLALLFFSLPLVAMPLLDAHGEETEFKPWSIQRYVADGDGWIPAPMDATTDGTIIIRKVAYPRDTTQTFSFQETVTGTIGNGGTLTQSGLAAPGTYRVEEVEPSGWYTRSIQCNDDNTYSDWYYNEVVVHLDPAETVECTFFNIEQGSEGCRESAGWWPYGTISGLAVYGSLAYVGSGAGFQVLDVSEPAHPILLGSTPLNSLTQGVTYSAGYAYVSQESYGVAVVDVSDSANPQHVTTIQRQGAINTAVIGNLLFVAAKYSGLHIYDITDPTTPNFVGQFNGVGYLRDVAVLGGYAYLADTAADGLLRVLDVSDPTLPSEVGSLAIPNSLKGVEVVANTVYVAASDSLRVVDVSSPANPTEIGSAYPSYGAEWVEVSGDRAYTSGWGLSVLDVSTPSTPTEIGGTYLGGWTPRFRVNGDVVHAAASHSGLRNVDVSLPAAPSIIGSFANPVGATDIKVDGGFAYLSLGYSGGLVIMDTSDASDPQIAALDVVPANRVDVSGNFAYIADGDYYVRIIDVTDPYAPTGVAIFNSPGSSGWPMSVTVAGDYAYVAYAYDGLRIVDVSDPFTPVEVGHADTPGFAEHVAVFGSYAYVADGDSGLRVIDVSNPFAPVEVGFLDTSGWVRDVEVRNGLAYLADDEDGLIIVDIGDPDTPVLLGSHKGTYGGGPYRVSLIGDFAYASTGYGYIDVFEISDPEHPMVIQTDYGPGGATAVDTAGGRVFIPQWDILLKILQPCDLIFADDLETGGPENWGNVVGGP